MGLRDRLLGRRTPEDAFADEAAALLREALGVQKVELRAAGVDSPGDVPG